MPLIGHADGKLRLQCVNTHEASTMVDGTTMEVQPQDWGLMSLRTSAQALAVRVYQCKVCGYTEIYSPTVLGEPVRP